MGDVRAMLFVSMIIQVFLYEDDAMLLANNWMICSEC